MERLTPLPQGAALELATAWVAHRAARANVRVVFLKGPTAHLQGLRPERLSADVDVLVEPDGVSALLADLEASGWGERFISREPRVVERHSTTLFHPDWPIDIDVHHRWPGFLLDAGTAFDVLWRMRDHRSTCGVEIPVTDEVSTALVLALHSLRQPRAFTRNTELPELIARFSGLHPGDAGAIALERAGELGAEQSAAPFLAALGATVERPQKPSEELLRWRLNSEAASRTDAWLLTLADVPLRRKPLVLFRAVFPPAEEFRGQHPEVGPGATGLALGWARRLGTGFRELPRAVRSVLRFERRRAGRQDP